ncbi:MAG: ribulose-phosphate 3-epimerase [Clostridiales bacterium]|nr:ribulose-phosphate 3-epimerase [Clostridiales bacterium]
MIKLAPSILSANFSYLAEDIRKVEKAGAQLLHVDVMDGHFVPNITIGPPVLSCLANYTNIPFDVHLMIENADDYIEKFIFKNTEVITVHAEGCTHLHRTLQSIKALNLKAGVALNPATPIDVLDYIWNDLDMILIMSVNPGFGGQNFIEAIFEKISQVREIIDRKGLNIDIQVDGGIKLDNVKKVIDAGANIIVAGSAIFGAEDVYKQTKQFLEEMNK